MTSLERWQRRIDAILEALEPAWGLSRAKARRALAAAAQQQQHGQSAGWTPTHTGEENVLKDLHAQRAHARRRRWLSK